jgi:hypothetical protein
MSRNYDASTLTQRRAQLAASGGFSSQKRRPSSGIFDASFLTSVRVGAMTEFTRFPTCIGVSPGCPCGPLAASLQAGVLPGAVSGIVFTVGSIIVSWAAPAQGEGPFQYTITPFLNGTALPSVTTSELTYRFTNLQDWQPYTFTVVASNAVGISPITVTSTTCLAPPADLTNFLASLSGPSGSYDPVVCLSYILNCSLEEVMKTVMAANVGPTRGARLMYLYIASLAQAYHWVTADTNVQGVKDGWDWTQSKNVSGPLSSADALVWMICACKYVNSFITTVPSMFVCPADTTARVKTAGGWEAWRTAWSAWYAQRMNDGSAAASTRQPTESANWGETLIVDGVTVNNISAYPAPQEWTKLKVNGVAQSYLTHDWGTVQSTCLTPSQEATILSSVLPVYGADRDAEIDMVKDMAAALTDQEKAIAEFWAGSTPNKMSPPLMCMWMCKEYLRAGVMRGPSHSGITQQGLIYSLLDLAVHLFEGSRVTWALKSQFMQARPIQEIRRRYAGQLVASWNGTIDGSQWTPYQPSAQITPPFSDFPSGHSHFSKAFALTMNKWFGSTVQAWPLTYNGETLFSPCLTTEETTTFGSFTIPRGASTVQPGVAPSSNVTLTFGTWDDMANSAGMSRLYGSIHCISAHTASQTTAVEVDSMINSSWDIRTSS